MFIRLLRGTASPSWCFVAFVPEINLFNFNLLVSVKMNKVMKFQEIIVNG
jgi:hypothetical protein